MQSKRGRPRLKENKQRIVLSVAIDPKAKVALDAECKRINTTRGRVVECLLAKLAVELAQKGDRDKWDDRRK
jgi:hypothetical protein